MKIAIPYLFKTPLYLNLQPLHREARHPHFEDCPLILLRRLF